MAGFNRMKGAVMSLTRELLPCPFCGGKARFNQIPHEDVSNMAGGEYVECEDCGACTNLVYSIKEDAKPELRDRWNRRSAAAAPKERSHDA